MGVSWLNANVQTGKQHPTPKTQQQQRQSSHRGLPKYHRVQMEPHKCLTHTALLVCNTFNEFWNRSIQWGIVMPIKTNVQLKWTWMYQNIQNVCGSMDRYVNAVHFKAPTYSTLPYTKKHKISSNRDHHSKPRQTLGKIQRDYDLTILGLD